MRLYHSCQSYCKAPLSATAKAAVAAATSAASATKRSSATASTAEGTATEGRPATSEGRTAWRGLLRRIGPRARGLLTGIVAARPAEVAFPLCAVVLAVHARRARCASRPSLVAKRSLLRSPHAEVAVRPREGVVARARMAYPNRGGIAPSPAVAPVARIVPGPVAAAPAVVPGPGCIVRPAPQTVIVPRDRHPQAQLFAYQGSYQ